VTEQNKAFSTEFAGQLVKEVKFFMADPEILENFKNGTGGAMIYEGVLQQLLKKRFPEFIINVFKAVWFDNEWETSIVFICPEIGRIKLDNIRISGKVKVEAAFG